MQVPEQNRAAFAAEAALAPIGGAIDMQSSLFSKITLSPQSMAKNGPADQRRHMSQWHTPVSVFEGIAENVTAPHRQCP